METNTNATRGTTRTPAALRHTLRAETTLNPDAFEVPDTVRAREQTYRTLREAVETARRLHEARPFGQHLRTTIRGPLGTFEVSQNGRIWGGDTEYHLDPLGNGLREFAPARRTIR